MDEDTRKTRRNRKVHADAEGTERDENREREIGSESTNTSTPRTEERREENIEEKEPLGPVVVEIPEQKEPKKRGRPKKDKTESKETAEKQATDLVLGITGMLSMVFGDHWAFSPEEARLVGEPLGRILERYSVLESVSKYSDVFALVYGVTVTVTPRILISLQKRGRKNVSSRPSGTENTTPNNTGQTISPGTNVKELLPVA